MWLLIKKIEIKLNFNDRKFLFLLSVSILPIFLIFGLYKNIFRYSGLASLFNVSKALSLYGLIYGARISIIGVNGIPRTIGIIQPLLLLLLIICFRKRSGLDFCIKKVFR